MENTLTIGDRFEGVLLATFIGLKSSRPRVRPLEYFDKEIRVEFPRKPREENPIGTRFRDDVKVSQKAKNDKPFGKPYLVVTNKSIAIVKDFTPNNKLLKAVRLNTVGNRAYKHIEQQFKKEPDLIPFAEFREKAYKHSRELPEKTVSKSSTLIQRSDIIKTYAISRSRGKCEGYSKDAPFLKMNGQPYLEVHHIIELSNNGSDSPTNVIALCPNCHAPVTHGKDGLDYNSQLKTKIEFLESSMDE
jgi:5-methylcytosine-specific restriction endonuclease McrA